MNIKEALRRRPINIAFIIIFMGLYTLNRLFLIHITEGVTNQFCRWHLNDLICPLVILPYIEVLVLSNGYEIVSIVKIISIGLCCAFIWEYVIPIFKVSSISDPLDVVCYLLGSFLYASALHISIMLEKGQLGVV